MYREFSKSLESFGNRISRQKMPLDLVHDILILTVLHRLVVFSAEQVFLFHNAGGIWKGNQVHGRTKRCNSYFTYTSYSFCNWVTFGCTDTPRVKCIFYPSDRKTEKSRTPRSSLALEPPFLILVTVFCFLPRQRRWPRLLNSVTRTVL